MNYKHFFMVLLLSICSLDKLDSKPLTYTNRTEEGMSIGFQNIGSHFIRAGTSKSLDEEGSIYNVTVVPSQQQECENECYKKHGSHWTAAYAIMKCKDKCYNNFPTIYMSKENLDSLNNLRKDLPSVMQIIFLIENGILIFKISPRSLKK